MHPTSSMVLVLIPLACTLSLSSSVSVSEKVSLTNSSRVSGELTKPRLIAYVNCLCGFGHEKSGDDVCGNDPNPSANYMLELEESGKSPITHYILSFLSFKDHEIQSDVGSIWDNGGGSTTDFRLEANLLAAMAAAQKQGKKVLLSLGGETGSHNFISYWNTKGVTTEEKVANMRLDIENVVIHFEKENDVGPLIVDGIDIDIELGGGYEVHSDKYNSTRDLIHAVPDNLLTAFVPQVGNGLCAAPTLDDLSTGGLDPTQAMGGQCMQPSSNGAPWSLGKLALETKRSDGSMKLDWLGIQYYNAVSAVCCGGGLNDTQSVLSTFQNFKNLALGWDAVTEDEMKENDSPWHPWRWYPGPWEAFEGLGPDKIVLGKPGCKGCAGSNYIDTSTMDLMFSLLGRTLSSQEKTFGGFLFWDLCRLFGTSGSFCVSGQCQPSVASDSSVAESLEHIYKAMLNMQLDRT